MGSCLSSKIKAESLSASGARSRSASKDGKSSSGGSSSCSGGGGGGGSRVSAAASAPPTPRSEGEILQSSNLRSFSFGDLRSATRNFRPDSVLGEGGFGSVFKGWIDERSFTAVRPGTGVVIAVKRLNLEGLQGHTEWLTEINYLGRLYHPNLVKLIGYCLEDEHRMLVYEFMPRGSLENHLFRRASYFQPLSWNLRMKVALGAAKGLAFLHGPEIGVIYRDFKSSNILLDSNFNAKLSDFGLAKDGPGAGKSHVSTRIMGTYGYAAPEYMATGHLTTKSDVYSYGVVLLEVLSGRRALDKNRPSNEQNLVEWARPYLGHKRRVFRVVDARLEGQYSQPGAYKAATLALRCLSNDPKNRPSMRDVVAVLEQLQNAKDVVVNNTPGVVGGPGHRHHHRHQEVRARNAASGGGRGGGGSTAARLKTRSLEKPQWCGRERRPVAASETSEYASSSLAASRIESICKSRGNWVSAHVYSLDHTDLGLLFIFHVVLLLAGLLVDTPPQQQFALEG